MHHKSEYPYRPLYPSTPVGERRVKSTALVEAAPAPRCWSQFRLVCFEFVHHHAAVRMSLGKRLVFRGFRFKIGQRDVRLCRVYVRNLEGDVRASVKVVHAEPRRSRRSSAEVEQDTGSQGAMDSTVESVRDVSTITGNGSSSSGTNSCSIEDASTCEHSQHPVTVVGKGGRGLLPAQASYIACCRSIHSTESRRSPYLRRAAFISARRRNGSHVPSRYIVWNRSGNDWSRTMSHRSAKDPEEVTAIHTFHCVPLHNREYNNSYVNRLLSLPFRRRTRIRTRLGQQYARIEPQANSIGYTGDTSGHV